MAAAGDERVPNEGGGAGNKFVKRPFLPEIKEEAENVCQEAGQYDSSGVSEASTHQGGNASIGMSDLEQILIQKPSTRSEIERLIELLHSRIADINIVEANGSLKQHKHGDKSDNLHAAAAVHSSKVVEEQIANAYKGIGTGKAPRQDLELLNNKNATLKASQQHPSTMEDLPEELLSNIFIRLLAKQLAQMRSVSKSWNALLSRSSFIKSHLHRSIHNSNHLLSFFDDEFLWSSPIPFSFEPCTTHLRGSPHHKLTNFIKLPPHFHFENHNHIRIIGSVNGLICYSQRHLYNDCVIHICNPSLSAVLTLPPYTTPSNSNTSLKIYFRFGYDPKTDDYKVVKLTGLTRKHTGYIMWWLEIEIYSMRKGTWEIITERFPSHITYIVDFDYVCADGHDGHLHWLCHIGKSLHPRRIVAFDLSSETFREIPLPDFSTLHYEDAYADDDENSYANTFGYEYVRSDVLGVLAGKLCVVSRLADATCEVWVMDVYGVAESWVKHQVFSRFIGNSCPLGFTSHDEFLLEESGDIYLFDLIANKEAPLKDDPGGGNIKVVEYVDSLVWITP